MRTGLILFVVLAVGGLSFWYWKQNSIPLNNASAGAMDSVSAAVDTPRSKHSHHLIAPNMHIDSIAIHKGPRELLVFSKDVLVKKYNVALGLAPVGKKEVEGDYKTPEGLYKIDGKNPLSLYHKSLGVSYPNADDIEHAKSLGQKPGGDIKIHGLMKNMFNTGKNHIKSNWTSGCIAVTNEEIDELYQQVKVGTPVFISP